MRFLIAVNFFVTILFLLCYSYQFYYILVGLFRKEREFKTGRLHRFAVIISARNEEKVIGNLLNTINMQNYPSELIDVFVAADNCTDKTAEIARKSGAVVYERFNNKRVGKGFALKFLFSKIEQNHGGIKAYDGYFVFDADNLLDKNYIAEMNKVFDNGYRVVTSYRNSKNYDSNWISAGYSLWFLREARYLNNARMIRGTSCAISGTGFLVSSEIIAKNKGWKHFLLTEDIEFTVDNVINGEKIGYCGKAVLFDEQPVTFSQSWKQRMRWAKGYYQIIVKYGLNLFKSIFKRRSFSAYDMFMTIAPCMVFTFTTLICFVLMMGIALINYSDKAFMFITAELALKILFSSYDLLFAVGLVTTATEWKNINASAIKKILYVFTFPIFMYTYVPISIAALFKKVQWEPITHTISKTINDMETIKIKC